MKELYDKGKKMDERTRRIIAVAAFALIALLSFTVIGNYASSAEKQAATIAVMILTNCVIPVLVLLAIIYMAKSVLNSVMVRIR